MEDRHGADGWVLAPVPDAILNQFAPQGMLTAADVEAATRRFKKALLERALRGAEGAHNSDPPSSILN
jgi:hypothetical protein